MSPGFAASQCFDAPWDLLCFESGRLHAQRHDQMMRPSIHDACLSCGRLSRAVGPPASPDAHDRRKLRRCADLAPPSGTLSGGAGDIFAIARPSCVQTVASRAEMSDLQKTANDDDVREKMDHLILVSEVMVKEDRRCQGEHRKARRHLPNTKTKEQQ